MWLKCSCSSFHGNSGAAEGSLNDASKQRTFCSLIIRNTQWIVAAPYLSISCFSSGQRWVKLTSLQPVLGFSLQTTQCLIIVSLLFLFYLRRVFFICLCFLFPSGLIPRLLGDVLSLWICNLLAHLINTYAIDDSVYYVLQLGASVI